MLLKKYPLEHAMGQTARITDIPYWTSQEQNVQEKLASLFPELTVQECARLASSSRVVAYAKNEWIFSEGESLGSADWLLSGNVELLKGSMAGKNTILHVVREDHFLDHCIFFGSGQAFVSALALSKCSILRIDAKVLRSVLMGNAAFAMRRKTYANNLSQAFSIPKDQAAAAISAAGLKEGLRGETLTLAQIALVSDQL